jgi:mRNA-degrading endonuclease toxin of MazEF toxin-antitoxin module
MGIPVPEAGLVISYAYLWHREHQAGHDEARKDRPAVIILAVQVDARGPVVTVVPITHAAPSQPEHAIEIPLPVKRQLGLDDARSWIVVNEGNEFLWPGYDLREVPGTDSYSYGFLPPRYFDRIIKAFVAYNRAGIGQLTPRD